MYDPVGTLASLTLWSHMRLVVEARKVTGNVAAMAANLNLDIYRVMIVNECLTTNPL